MEIPFSTHQISKDVNDYYQYGRYGGKTGAFKRLWGEWKSLQSFWRVIKQ